MEWLIIGWIGTILSFGMAGYELSQSDKHSKAKAIFLLFGGQIFLLVFIAGIVSTSQL